MATNSLQVGMRRGENEVYAQTLTEEGKAAVTALLKTPKFFKPGTSEPETLSEYTDRNVLEYAKTVTFGLNLLEVAQNGQDIESLHCTALKVKSSVQEITVDLPPPPPTQDPPLPFAPTNKKISTQKHNADMKGTSADDNPSNVGNNSSGKPSIHRNKRPSYKPVQHKKGWGHARAPKQKVKEKNVENRDEKVETERSQGSRTPPQRPPDPVVNDSDESRMHALIGKLHGIERLFELLGSGSEKAQSVLRRAKVLENAILEPRSPETRSTDLSLLESDLNILNNLLADRNK